MKKLICALMALVLVLGLSVSASAATVTSPGSSEVGTVSVVVTGLGGGTSTVYYVVMDWESLTFTYDFEEGSSVWNPEKHSYSASGGGRAHWVNSSADITLTNHSNTALSVSLAFAGSGTRKTVNNVVAAINNPSFTLASGVGKSFAQADQKTATVSVSGEPNVQQGFDIGKIVVTIT